MMTPMTDHGGMSRGLTAPLRVEAPRAAGVAGLVFVVLFTTSVVILDRHPDAESSAAEIDRWYSGGDRSASLVGLYLLPFAGIAFLWFAAAIRQNVLVRGDRFFDSVVVGSALLFIAMLFATGAAAGGLYASVQFRGAPAPGPDAVGGSRALAYALFFVYALRAAAVFVIASSTVGMRTGVLPRWLGISGILLALVMLFSVAYFSVLVLLFPLWVTVMSIVILRGSGSGSKRELGEPAA